MGYAQQAGVTKGFGDYNPPPWRRHTMRHLLARWIPTTIWRWTSFTSTHRLCD